MPNNATREKSKRSVYEMWRSRKHKGLHIETSVDLNKNAGRSILIVSLARRAFPFPSPLIVTGDPIQSKKGRMPPGIVSQEKPGHATPRLLDPVLASQGCQGRRNIRTMPTRRQSRDKVARIASFDERQVCDSCRLLKLETNRSCFETAMAGFHPVRSLAGRCSQSHLARLSCTQCRP